MASDSRGMRPVDGALLMFDRGFKVFPVAAGKKIPLVSGWQDWAAKATRESIEDFADENPSCNWGVHCVGITVLDVDNSEKDGKKKDGGKALADLNVGPINTFTVRTPTGGVHHYFEGETQNSVSKIGRYLDTRSEGGYVVAPYSIVGGKTYDVVNDHEVAPVPEWITSKLAERKGPIEVLTPETFFSEGGRDSALTSYAGKMRATMGLDADEMLPSLLAMNDKRCIPPLETWQVEKIARSIGSYAPGLAEAAADFSEQIEANKDSRPFDTEEFTGYPPRREWLIKDWLPKREISSLYGSGGTGKSLVALQMGESISRGIPFLQVDPAEQVTVIGVFCEDNRDEIHRRMFDIRNAVEYQLPGANPRKKFLAWPRVGHLNDLVRFNAQRTDLEPGFFMPALKAALQETPGHKLLILDTLADIYVGDEIDRAMVNRFVKTFLGGLIKEFDCTILLLAHPSRTGQKDGSVYSGSTAWENAVRNRLALVDYDPKVKNGIMALERMKSNYAKRGERIGIKWDEGRYITMTKSETSMLEKSEKSRGAIEAVAAAMGRRREMSMNEIVSAIQQCPDVPESFRIMASNTMRASIKAAIGVASSFGDSVYHCTEIKKARNSYWVVTRGPLNDEIFGVLEDENDEFLS